MCLFAKNIPKQFFLAGHAQFVVITASQRKQEQRTFYNFLNFKNNKCINNDASKQFTHITFLYRIKVP